MDINYILRTGASLYTVIHGLIGKDYLLLTDVPTCLSINESTDILQYSDCISGDLHMSEARECYLPLKLALTSLKTYYPACLLTIKSNAVAVFYGNNGSFKNFDSHSRDVYGNVHGNGTSVLLEFDDLDALVGYLQDIYSINVYPIVPFEIRGVNVSKLQHHQQGNSSAACKETVVNDDDLVSSSVQDISKMQRKRKGDLLSSYEPLAKQRTVQPVARHFKHI